MYQAKSNWERGGIIAAACLIAVSGRNKNACYAAVPLATYEDHAGGFSALLHIPKILGPGTGAKNASAQILSWGKETACQYEKDKCSSGGAGNYHVQMGYETAANTPCYFSLKVWKTLEMADTMEENRYYTIEKRSGRLLHLCDFLKSQEAVETVNQRIFEQMEERTQQSPNVSFFTGAQGFRGLTGKEPFYINGQNELVISFDKYTITPGVMGVQTFPVGRIQNGCLR